MDRTGKKRNEMEMRQFRTKLSVTQFGSSNRGIQLKPLIPA